MAERERVLLVGIVRGLDDRQEALDSIEELAALTRTAGGQVVAIVVQERKAIDRATFVGRGKAEEIASLCRAKAVDVVIFDDDLSPAQARNVENLTGARVIDRSQLILDIFALGARTSTAKAQVELAQLQYTLPRLAGMWEHLSRTGGGIGTRGPGETQLEADRRRVRRRIFTLKRTLKKVEQARAVSSRRRQRFVNASLVGYTNTGKSTLFNHLTQASVPTRDRLFETLDATTRVLRLPSRETLLLSDTVGFIRKIPHHLVASFHATLECVVEADLLIHVADLSHADYAGQIDTVRSVLGDIGAGGKKEILVLNKVDIVDDRTVLRAASRQYPEAVPVSALRGWGVEELNERLLEMLLDAKEEVMLVLPPEDGELLAYVARCGTVLGRESVDGRISLRVRIDRRYLKPLSRYIGAARPSTGKSG